MFVRSVITRVSDTVVVALPRSLVRNGSSCLVAEIEKAQVCHHESLSVGGCSDNQMVRLEVSARLLLQMHTT